MRLKRTEPDSCDNCISVMKNEPMSSCKNHKRLLPSKYKLTELICEDGYEDDNSRLIT